MKRMKYGKTAAMAGLFVLAFLLVPVFADEGERKVKLDQVPPKVRTAILQAVGKGRLVDIGEFTKGKEKTYEIEMVVEGKEFDVLFSSDGEELRRSFEGYKSEKKLERKEEEREEEQGEEEKGEGEEQGGHGRKFQAEFDLDQRAFVSTGRNRFFILEPGYHLVLDGKEGEHAVRLEVVVLEETRAFGKIETRVVEERESMDGELKEVSRNFYAMDARTRSIFYFGEEVDLYEKGKVVGHEGAWMHRQDGARAGMMMPGEAVLGARYYQEVSPGKAMDRAEIVSLKAALDTPAGRFEDCLRCREENPLDKEVEYKTYAPGIGLIQDEGLLLVEYGFTR